MKRCCCYFPMTKDPTRAITRWINVSPSVDYCQKSVYSGKMEEVGKYNNNSGATECKGHPESTMTALVEDMRPTVSEKVIKVFQSEQFCS